MTSLYGIGLDLSVAKIHHEFKVHILKIGGNVVEKLQKIFEMIDLNKNGKLDLTEFEKGLNKFGFFPKKVEVQALLKYYDLNNDNMIDFKEFCKALREPLNERKFKMVSKTFDSLLTSDSQNTIPLKELSMRIDFSKHELYLTNKKELEELKLDFEKQFLESNISKQDFIHYYEGISLLIPSDLAFIQLIEKSWGVMENTDNEKDKAIIQNIMNSLRSCLLSIIKGKNDLENIRKLFISFDVKSSLSLTFDEFANAVKRIHLKIEEKMLGVVFKKIDLNNSGYIEFQEFYDFLMN